ncbi:MAG TPA: hypothetical protein ENJ50_05050, partial [Planctomycetaceae bacterium]|nr:hypothetical protein [Planctomycetaceae bacterium]
MTHKIDQLFRRTEKQIRDLLIGDFSDRAKQVGFEELLHLAIRQTTDQVRTDFNALAYKSYRSATNVFLDKIPKSWLERLIPPETRAAFEEVHYPSPPTFLKFDAGRLSIVTEESPEGPYVFDIPINPFQHLNLSDDEKRELIERIVFPPLTEKEVDEILQREVTLPDGNKVNWAERLDRLSSQIPNKQIAFNELVRGYADGENLQKLKSRIKPLVSGIESAAKRVARTEGMRVAEQMQRKSWDDLGDMFDGAQIIAVLDVNTRPHHATRNGTIYYKDADKANGTTRKTMAELPDLPDEPNCRCWTSPVLSPPGEWKDDPATHASHASGAADPKTVSDWFATARPLERKVVVGVQRYNLVAEKLNGVREPEWSDFIDDNGKLLSADKLLKETALQRQARKERLDKTIRERGRLLSTISRKGFESPTRRPTRLTNITFTGVFDPSDMASLTGERVRLAILNGVKGEKQTRAVGKIIREYIEHPDVAMANKRISELKERRSVATSKKQLDVVAKLGAEIDELHSRIVNVRRTRYLMVMRNVRDMGHPKPMPFTAGSDTAAEKLLIESQRFFPFDWIGRSMRYGPIRALTQKNKSYYDHAQETLSINPWDREQRATAVHELVHRFEAIIPGFLKLEGAHYNFRTRRSKQRTAKGDPPFPMYRDTWMGSRKQGPGDYMGRYYPQENAYEISTMS